MGIGPKDALTFRAVINAIDASVLFMIYYPEAYIEGPL
jgi:hypothetical protein